jgi:serine kinase of HPr protein (carbohydrate metabolism regulator)
MSSHADERSCGTRNIHATALVVGETGILVTGPSDSGKSRFARHCLAVAGLRGRYAALVSDDRVQVTNCHGRLLAETPETIVGLIEIRGFGIIRVDHIPAAVMHLAISLETAEDAERMPHMRRFEPVPGLDLPLYTVVPDPFADPVDLIDAMRKEKFVR